MRWRMSTSTTTTPSVSSFWTAFDDSTQPINVVRGPRRSFFSARLERLYSPRCPEPLCPPARGARRDVATRLVVSLPTRSTGVALTRPGHQFLQRLGVTGPAPIDLVRGVETVAVQQRALLTRLGGFVLGRDLRFFLGGERAPLRRARERCLTEPSSTGRSTRVVAVINLPRPWWGGTAPGSRVSQDPDAEGLSHFCLTASSRHHAEDGAAGKETEHTA